MNDLSSGSEGKYQPKQSWNTVEAENIAYMDMYQTLRQDADSQDQ